MDAKVYLFGQFLGLYNMLPRDALDFYIYARSQILAADGGAAAKYVEDAHEEVVVELHTAIDIAHRLGADFYCAEAQIATLISQERGGEGAISKSEIVRELSDAVLDVALAGSKKEARRKSSQKLAAAVHAVAAANKLRSQRRKSDVVVAYHGFVTVDKYLSKMLECYLIHRDRLEGLFQDLFRAFDDNGDGVLSFAEFEVLLKRISPSVSSSFIHAIFRKAVGVASTGGEGGGGNIDSKIFAASLHSYGIFSSFPDHKLADVIANVEAQERSKKKKKKKKTKGRA